MKKWVATGGAAAAAFLLLWESDRVLQGVRAGMRLCLESVIPSLFVFMILADFLSSADLAPALLWPFRLVCRLFQLPGETAPVLAVSLVGGYPAGARMVGNLVRQGRLGPRTGEKLLCSCVCCSPSFLTGAVGAAVFGSARMGLLLWLCQTAAMVVTGVLAGFLMPCDRAEGDPFAGEQDYAACFVRSVTGAGRAVFAICCFVLLFSAVQTFAELLPGGRVLSGLLEVTVGCGGLKGISFRQALILSTIYTSLGGVCVWMQLGCFLRGTGVRLGAFLLFRLPHCFFSLLFTLLSVRFCHITAEVFSSFSQPLPQNGSGSVTAAVCLVMLCLMLLLTLPQSGKKPCREEKSVL